MALQREFPQYAGYFTHRGARRRQEGDPNYQHRLLGRFDGADGMKTGFICPSGFNLIASATRNGRTLVASCSAPISPQRAPTMPPTCSTRALTQAHVPSVDARELTPYGDGRDTADRHA